MSNKERREHNKTFDKDVEKQDKDDPNSAAVPRPHQGLPSSDDPKSSPNTDTKGRRGSDESDKPKIEGFAILKYATKPLLLLIALPAYKELIESLWRHFNFVRFPDQVKEDQENRFLFYWILAGIFPLFSVLLSPRRTATEKKSEDWLHKILKSDSIKPIWQRIERAWRHAKKVWHENVWQHLEEKCPRCADVCRRVKKTPHLFNFSLAAAFAGFYSIGVIKYAGTLQKLYPVSVSVDQFSRYFFWSTIGVCLVLLIWSLSRWIKNEKEENEGSERILSLLICVWAFIFIFATPYEEFRENLQKRELENKVSNQERMITTEELLTRDLRKSTNDLRETTRDLQEEIARLISANQNFDAALEPFKSPGPLWSKDEGR